MGGICSSSLVRIQSICRVSHQGENRSERLQVFTTCGSAAKRDFLLARFPGLQAENIGDSRSCSFEALVMKATAGRGVQLILNSLADDKLQVRHSTVCHYSTLSLL